MTKQERQDILLSAITQWGVNAQLLMLEEESIECAMAVHKYINRNGSIDNVYEEVADLSIMIEQVGLFLDNERINEIVIQKVQRLKDRLEKGKNKD